MDKARLLAWLLERAKTEQPIAGAIYEGLAARVRRGDFDEEGDG